MEDTNRDKLYDLYTKETLELLTKQMELLQERSRTAVNDDLALLTEAMNKLAQTIAWGHETNAMLHRPMQWTV